MNKTNTEVFIKFLKENKIYHSPNSLKWYFNHVLFDKIDFKNKKVLDIGGGVGLTSFFAAARNAIRVDLVEPLSDGSGSVEFEKFNKIKNGISSFSKRVCHINATIQEFNENNEKYDIVVLHNSINHINEEACINLLNSKKSKNEYLSYFKKIYTLMSEESIIVIADCTNNNFFDTIRLKAPLAWTIEWEKHQKPETWSNLLHEVGFSNFNIQWTSPKQLRFFGKILFANKFASFFLSSHFVLTAHKN